MSPVCPEGHASQTSDYCDRCGLPISEGASRGLPISEGASPVAPPSDAAPEPHEDEDTSPAIRHGPCPVCDTPRSSDDRFCETCGHEFASPGNGARPSWELVASASREQFERVVASGISFPAEAPDRRFLLDAPRVRIGRSRGADDSKPEVDLAGSPEDPGISRLHAGLERQDDGSYAVRDLGSTNGTTVNDDPQPIAVDVLVPLKPGDRIRIGAWTTITLVAR